MAQKVDLAKHSVAFFDDKRVDKPGFYTLEGKSEKSTVIVQDHGEFALVDATNDEGKVVQVPDVDVRGRPVFLEEAEPVDEIEVKHETNMTPGRRVEPAKDGEGFVYALGSDK